MRSIYITFLFLFFESVKAQDFNSLNSNNVLSYLSNNSDVKLSQLGNNNKIILQLHNSSINVIQNGKDNFLNYDSKNNNLENYSLRISTYGTNNQIYVTGTNFISNGMNLDIKANNKKVFINNR